MFVTHRRNDRRAEIASVGSPKATPPKAVRKPAPSLQNRKSLYLQPHIRAELAGSDNVSARLEEIAMRFDVLRSACCPALSESAWRGLVIALKEDISSIEAEAGPVRAVANRVLDYAELLSTHASIDAEDLARKVMGWSDAQAVAVIDYVWRFWRVSSEIPFRQRLAIVGAKTAIEEG